jgi:hypothetical protein
VSRPVVSSPAPSAEDACPLAAWGCCAELPRPDWLLVSGHDTSDGRVEYCRCACAAFVILREGEVAAFTGPRLA